MKGFKNMSISVYGAVKILASKFLVVIETDKTLLGFAVYETPCINA